MAETGARLGAPAPSAPPRVGRREAAVLAALLVVTATVYCWDLDIQRWGNAYYSAVVQTGALSWKSFLFGSLEPGNVTSSDKPPAAFWVMALSVRAFGLSSWSLMLPQAVESVAMVVVLHRAVRRLAGPLAAVLAATVLATTPVVLALARYNDPDTLMTLMVVVGAYCCVRATESDAWRWLVATGVALGLAFLAKWGAALLPAPGLALALVGTRRRSLTAHVRRLAVVAGAAAVSGLWWVALMATVPPSERPYADSSNGSVLDLVLGQDGFNRLAAPRAHTDSVSTVSATAGLLRLFARPFSGQVAWLVPLALAVLLLEVVRARGRPGPGHLLFGGWLVTSLLVFSLMGGSMHPYYTVLLAPAAAAVVGMGMAGLVRERHTGVAMVLVVGSSCYAVAVVHAYRMPAWTGWAVGGLAVTGVVLYAGARPASARPRTARAVRRLATVPLAAALLLGPAVFGVATVRHPVNGADPLAGPGRSLVPASYPSGLVRYLEAGSHGDAWLAAVPRGTAAGLLQLQSGAPVLPLGGFTGHSAAPTLSQVRAWVGQDRLRYLLLPEHDGGYPATTGTPQRVGTTAGILAWARQTGCPHVLPGSTYVVLDLEEGPCRR